jgi:hypothetical protein
VETGLTDGMTYERHGYIGRFFYFLTLLLEESKPLASSITRKESMVLKSLKDIKKIRILQADKGKSMVVLNESTFKEKIRGI